MYKNLEERIRNLEELICLLPNRTWDEPPKEEKKDKMVEDINTILENTKGLNPFLDYAANDIARHIRDNCNEYFECWHTYNGRGNYNWRVKAK